MLCSVLTDCRDVLLSSCQQMVALAIVLMYKEMRLFYGRYAFLCMLLWSGGEGTKDSQDGALQGHAAAVTHITINERSSQIISLSADKVIKVLLTFEPHSCRLASSCTQHALPQLCLLYEQCKSLCIQHLYRTLHPCSANCVLVLASNLASHWVVECFAKLLP